METRNSLFFLYIKLKTEKLTDDEGFLNIDHL